MKTILNLNGTELTEQDYQDLNAITPFFSLGDDLRKATFLTTLEDDLNIETFTSYDSPTKTFHEDDESIEEECINSYSPIHLMYQFYFENVDSHTVRLTSVEILEVSTGHIVSADYREEMPQRWPEDYERLVSHYDPIVSILSR